MVTIVFVTISVHLIACSLHLRTFWNAITQKVGTEVKIASYGTTSFKTRCYSTPIGILVFKCDASRRLGARQGKVLILIKIYPSIKKNSSFYIFCQIKVIKGGKCLNCHPVIMEYWTAYFWLRLEIQGYLFKFINYIEWNGRSWFFFVCDTSLVYILKKGDRV